MTEPSFADLGVSAPVIDALSRYGIDAPFQIQTMVLPDAIAGRDVLGRSKTGSGKTLGFAIPIVERLDPSGTRPLRARAWCRPASSRCRWPRR